MQQQTLWRGFLTAHQDFGNVLAGGDSYCSLPAPRKDLRVPDWGSLHVGCKSGEKKKFFAFWKSFCDFSAPNEPFRMYDGIFDAYASRVINLAHFFDAPRVPWHF